MKQPLTIRRIRYGGVACLYLLSVIANTIMLTGIQVVSAETAKPAPPSAECEWFGGYSRETVNRATTSSTDHVDRSFVEMISAPVDGQACGMKWNADYSLHYFTTSLIACLGDLDYKTSTSTETRNAQGSGVGDYTVSIGTDWQAGKHFPNVYGSSDIKFGGTQTIEVTNGCDGDTKTVSPLDVGPWAIYLGCQADSVGDNYYVESNAQVLSGKCSYVTSSTNPDAQVEQSHVDTYTWNFRRTVCDQAIDTDGGGVSDCDEFDQGTSHKNAADDKALDSDGDGVVDSSDNCMATPNADQANFDNDNEGNLCDSDDDNDGRPDANDAFPFDSTEWSDNDSDGVGDNKDVDDDNDGLLDINEFGSGTNPMVYDTDGDGVGDGQDACPLVAGLDTLRGCPPVAGPVKVNLDINFTAFWQDVQFDVFKKGSDNVVLRGSSSATVEGTDEQKAMIRSVCIMPHWTVQHKKGTRSTVTAGWYEGATYLNGTPADFWQNPTNILNVGSELRSQQPVCSSQGQASAVYSQSSRGPLSVSTNPVGNAFDSVDFHQVIFGMDVTVALYDGRTYTYSLDEAEKAASKPPEVDSMTRFRSFKAEF